MTLNIPIHSWIFGTHRHINENDDKTRYKFSYLILRKMSNRREMVDVPENTDIQVNAPWYREPLLHIYNSRQVPTMLEHAEEEPTPHHNYIIAFFILLLLFFITKLAYKFFKESKSYYANFLTSYRAERSSIENGTQDIRSETPGTERTIITIDGQQHEFTVTTEERNPEFPPSYNEAVARKRDNPPPYCVVALKNDKLQETQAHVYYDRTESVVSNNEASFAERMRRFEESDSDDSVHVRRPMDDAYGAPSFKCGFKMSV